MRYTTIVAGRRRRPPKGPDVLLAADGQSLVEPLERPNMEPSGGVSVDVAYAVVLPLGIVSPVESTNSGRDPGIQASPPASRLPLRRCAQPSPPVAIARRCRGASPA